MLDDARTQTGGGAPALDALLALACACARTAEVVAVAGAPAPAENVGLVGVLEILAAGCAQPHHVIAGARRALECRGCEGT